MKHTQTNHYVIMFFIMLLSGLLSTMNVWVDKVDDIRFSINDAYMTLLMTGWMFLFMGLIYQELSVGSIGLSLGGYVNSKKRTIRSVWIKLDGPKP